MAKVKYTLSQGGLFRRWRHVILCNNHNLEFIGHSYSQPLGVDITLYHYQCSNCKMTAKHEFRGRLIPNSTNGDKENG